MTWRCVTCDKIFETLDGAVLVSRAARSQVTIYKVAGEIHSLRKIRPMSEAKHRAWHKDIPKIGCEFCFPSPPEPPPPQPPVERVLLQEVVAALAELPEPQPEVIAEPEIEDESESESVTTMGAAFKRIQRDSC